MAKDKLLDFDKALELFEPVLGFEGLVEVQQLVLRHHRTPPFAPRAGALSRIGPPHESTSSASSAAPTR